MIWILLLCSCLLRLASSVFEDNELIGEPEIICNAETIDMKFRTKRPFSGKVFVKGNYDRPGCRVDYGAMKAKGIPEGSIRLNHGACNMDRQRMLSPEGMMFSTVLVVSFHPLFLTKMDKAFNIRCMYHETAKTVNASLDVSMIPTESLTANIPVPTCSYTIRKDQLDGEILHFARVGDQVVHRWQCDTEDYGLLVHSCYVEDGHGDKQMVINEKGCHTDRLLLGDPTYVEALNLAYREGFVFKFADRVAVRFQCEIRLCIKEDGGCDGITPPLCLDTNDIHDSEVHSANISSVPYRNKRNARLTESDVISQTIFVSDIDQTTDSQSTTTCILVHKTTLLVIATSALIVSSATLLILYFRVKRCISKPKQQNFY